MSQSASITVFHTPKSRSNPWFAADARYIYKLQPTDIGLPRMPTYDSHHTMIVVARDSKVARKLAAASAADETAGFWTNTVYSSCQKVGLARKPNGQSPAREKVLAAA